MRYLGIDYGKSKVGLAISEGQIASPFKVLSINSLDSALSQVETVIESEEITRVVVGIPEGTTGEMVKKFVKALNNRMKDKQVEVIETDETLTSVDARKMMIDLNLSQKERQKEDAYSAMLILQRFLNTLS